MLNRRGLRIKVMQNLYAYHQNEKLQIGGALKNLQRSVDATYQLYAFVLLNIRYVAHYAEKQKKIKEQKLLAKDTDKAISLRICTENPLIARLHTDESLLEVVKAKKLTSYIDTNIVKDLFKKLQATEAYQQYIEVEKLSKSTHTKIIDTMYREVLMEYEPFTSLLEDLFINWQDDKKAIETNINFMLKNFGRIKNSNKFRFINYPRDWKERLAFSQDLLQKSIEKDNELEKMVVPQLKNWEIERVTKIDIILIKMALCEFLYFSTIPIKVTLNEYIDVSKMYSTPKSKDFINGILDKLMKILQSEGKIVKQGRGLMG